MKDRDQLHAPMDHLFSKDFPLPILHEVGLWSLSGKFVEGKIFPLPGIEIRFLVRPACSLVTIPTEMSRKNLEAE